MLIDHYRNPVAPVVYSAWNPSDKDADVSLSSGDTVATVTNAYGNVRGVQGWSDSVSATRYFEVEVTAADGRVSVGVAGPSASLGAWIAADSSATIYYGFNGVIYRGGATIGTNATYTTGDVIGVKVELGGGAALVTWYKNGAAQAETDLIFGLVTVYPVWGVGIDTGGTRTGTINTGPTFSALPSGASAWG